MSGNKVRPDTFEVIRIEGSDREYLVNAKYDRIDRFEWLGHHMLKIFDDEDGLISMHIDANTAKQVADYTGIPIVDRDFILQSEFEGYLRAQEKLMDGWTDVQEPPAPGSFDVA